MGAGIESFARKDEFFMKARDFGLFHSNYSAIELMDLANVLREPETSLEKALTKLGTVLKKPGEFYGAIEDISKLAVARYAMERGASPAQAVKLANKILFDYSSVSYVVGQVRKLPYPFITWSAKELPRLFETAIRRPGKFVVLGSLITVMSMLSRATLGISGDDEDKLKPDYIRGKSAILLPFRDSAGRLQWIDISYIMPWEGFMPLSQGQVDVPQVGKMGHILLSVYNCFVLNYDQFTGQQIAKDFQSDAHQTRARVEYLIKAGLPQLVHLAFYKIPNAIRDDKKKYKTEILKILSGEIGGIKFVSDITDKQGAIYKHSEKDYYLGIYDIKQELASGKISQEQATKDINQLIKKYQNVIKTH
jgi:hypothetical protein